MSFLVIKIQYLSFRFYYAAGTYYQQQFKWSLKNARDFFILLTETSFVTSVS